MNKNGLLIKINVIVVCVLLNAVGGDKPFKEAKAFSNDIYERHKNKTITESSVELKDEDNTDFKSLNWTLINEKYENFLPKIPYPWFGNSEIKLDGVFKSALEISKYYLPVPFYPGITEECRGAVNSLTLPDNLGFTIALVDSWGKLADGILRGNFKPIGMYEECILLQSDNSSMKGRYCFLQVSFGTGAMGQRKLNPDERMPAIIEPRSDTYYSYGTCIPHVCTTDDMQHSLQNVYDNEGHNRTVYKVHCHAIDDKEILTAGDISMIVFLSIMIAVLTIATLADVYTERYHSHLRKGSLRFVLTFSLYTNIRKLFTINVNAPKSSITCLHGMRSLSMLWVAYCHEYLFTLFETSNLFDVKRKTSNFMYQIFFNGTFSVDSFFVFSGLLVSCLTLQAMSKNKGKINLPMFYLHRYIRLTPALAFVAWFQATIARFMVDGPYASRFDFVFQNCRGKWWANILYVDNYAVDNLVDGKADCVGQAWYLAVDMQIYIITPLIFLPLYHSRVWGKVWLGFCTLASCLIPGLITVFLDLPPFPKVDAASEVSYAYNTYIAANPICRAGPYLVGIWAGYLIYRLGESKLKLTYWQVALGWTLSTGIALSVLFGIWKYNVYNGDTNWNVATQFFYGGFGRAAWGLPLVWVIIACHNGYGGPVNWFLSHPVFQPLSRLTYAMYLSSLGIQFAILYSNKQLFYFGHLYKLIEFCGLLFFIWISAVILTLMIESPIIALEKEILKREKPQDKIQVQRQETSLNLEAGEEKKIFD